MDTDGIREMISLWLKDHKVKRAELAQEAGYTAQYINDIMSRRPISERTEKTLAAAMKRIEERASKDLSEIAVTLSEQDIDEIYKTAEELKLSIDSFVNMLIRKANKRPASKEKEPVRRQFTPVETFPAVAASLDYTTQVAGNTAAGKPSSGETVPQDIRIYRPLEWGEFVLRVNGKSMEPEIPDESLVIIKKYEDYLFPALGSLVVYNEGNDYTLKKLAKRKNPETGKMEYVLKSINPAYKDVEPIAEGKISGIYVETLDRWENA